MKRIFILLSCILVLGSLSTKVFAQNTYIAKFGKLPAGELKNYFNDKVNRKSIEDILNSATSNDAEHLKNLKRILIDSDFNEEAYFIAYIELTELRLLDDDSLVKSLVTGQIKRGIHVLLAYRDGNITLFKKLTHRLFTLPPSHFTGIDDTSFKDILNDLETYFLKLQEYSRIDTDLYSDDYSLCVAYLYMRFTHITESKKGNEHSVLDAAATTISKMLNSNVSPDDIHNLINTLAPEELEMLLKIKMFRFDEAKAQILSHFDRDPDAKRGYKYETLESAVYMASQISSDKLAHRLRLFDLLPILWDMQTGIGFVQQIGSVKDKMRTEGYSLQEIKELYWDEKIGQNLVIN